MRRLGKTLEWTEWKVVEYLNENGFIYQHVFNEDEKGISIEVKYPDTFEEAKEFVIKYKSQAYTDQNIC